ncbi:MAG: protoheme IX farnesyltransferase [Chloroflexi bacterium]|nr:protoheme IX farnesyltransferase [Chloroflexota bacterium]
MLKRLYVPTAWAVLASALLAIIVGGVVRVTGSGLGCPDWPLCHGRIIPPADLGAWLEYSHRVAAAATGVLTVLLAMAAFSRYRWGDKILYLVLAAPALLLLQVALGALNVLWELPPPVGLVHTGVAMAFVGLLAVVAVSTAGPVKWQAAIAQGPRATTYRWVMVGLGLATFLLILSGAYATRTNASLACLGYPLCGRVAQMGEPQWVSMIHRGMTALVALVMLGAVGVAWALRRRVVLTLTVLLAGLLAVQTGLGATNVLLLLPAWSRGAHLAVAALFFAAVMLLLGVLWRGASGEKAFPGLRRLVRSHVGLTKPRIIVLLLITTLAGMLAAAGAAVPWDVTLATLAGGFLCAGGAGTINSYLDRERDLVMARTSRRPLPAGEVSPRVALVFGIAISLLSVPLFLYVNTLTAILAAIAWLYYVFLYSMYLKGRTTQNIVIGGAAGAFPPLIGWVAVRGVLDLSGVFLFLIVFLWTPPHAWALAMLAKDDYRKVKIPMLPVVRGEAETSRQILLYGVALLVVTLAPAVLGLFGALYLAVAVLLGGFLLALALRLYRSPDRVWASRLYRYSTVYLGLLFLALVLDRTLMS